MVSGIPCACALLATYLSVEAVGYLYVGKSAMFHYTHFETPLLSVT